jgi:hypothetical protein
MPELHFTPSTRILRGLDEIAAYLRVSRPTAFRYIRDYSLPAMRLSCYMTSPTLIDMWIIAVWSEQSRAAKLPSNENELDPDNELT